MGHTTMGQTLVICCTPEALLTFFQSLHFRANTIPNINLALFTGMALPFAYSKVVLLPLAAALIFLVVSNLGFLKQNLNANTDQLIKSISEKDAKIESLQKVIYSLRQDYLEFSKSLPSIPLVTDPQTSPPLTWLSQSGSAFSGRRAVVPREGFFQSHGSECPAADTSVRKMPSSSVGQECWWILDLDALKGLGYSANHQDKVRQML
jgi:hypothetical protein